ncbi:MAG: ATP synthase F0 subunit B [Treponema sp.]|jgi:F-type H+-transporting ATPase subunit b|nr:ATP synthase F0 subunit B [Treponema sp.]
MLDFSVTLIITVINITVLFLILRALLFKPVTKFMAERAKRIQDSINETLRDRSSAQKLMEQYREKIKTAQGKADEIVSAGRKSAEIEAEQIVAEGKATAQALVDAARRQMEAERQAMHARFSLEAAALVMAASSRLVQRDISGDDNRRYANMLLDELAAQKGNG